MSNLSQIKRREMLDYIAELKEVHNDDESIRALNKIEIALTEKKYGLVWEEHSENVDEMLKNNIPVFNETKDFLIKKIESERFNFLLEGDNLHSLKLLEKTHKEKIDVIYIDPPYNTGNEDFKYDDNFIDKNDGFKHSKWLSFMSKRLDIAYNLLADDGIIAISIDENEIAPLRMLCDEIFGEDNLLSNQHIQVRYASKSLNEKNDWQPLMEYVLIYAKNKLKFKANLPYEDYNLEKFIFEFEELTEGNTINLGGKKVVIFKQGEWKVKKHKKEDGKIGLLKETWASGSVLTGNTSGKFFDQHISTRKEIDGLKSLYKVYGIGEDGIGYRYFTGPQRANAIRGKFYSGVPLVRVEELNSEEGSLKYKPIVNYIDYSADFGNIRHEGEVSFNNGKKPIKMIKEIINYHKNKDIIVLDFFAGSGTTGHAVIDLNKEDKGNRKYILCTNNENKICEEITYKRLKNIQKDLPHNLKYYKTNFIPRFTKEEEILSDKLLKHIKEMVELENMCEIDGVNKILILKQDELENVKIDKIKEKSTIYLASYILLSREIENQIINKEIKIIDIPDYYFINELKEVNER